MNRHQEQDAERVHGQAPAEGAEGDVPDADIRRHSQHAAEGDDPDEDGVEADGESSDT